MIFLRYIIMIIIRYIRQKYGPSKPLKGARIAGCLHMTVQVHHQVLHMIVTAKRYYRCDCSGQYHQYAADHIGHNENNKKILIITPSQVPQPTLLQLSWRI